MESTTQSLCSLYSNSYTQASSCHSRTSRVQQLTELSHLTQPVLTPAIAQGNCLTCAYLCRQRLYDLV